MKAMVLEKQAPIETLPLKMKNIPEPKFSGHEILVKVEACGVCHTDLHLIEGDLYRNLKMPLIPGHEVVGVVARAGEKSAVKVGERVGMGWVYSYCGECVNCRSGRDNICLKRESTGCTKDGGYQEQIKLDSRFVTKIPKKLSPEQAAPLFCAGITAYHGMKLISPKKSENVAVIGVGGLGSYAIRFAKMAGANVYAFSRNPEHLKLAEEMGADEMIDSDVGLTENIRKREITAALVFAPSAIVLEQTLAGLPRGGRALMAGGIQRIDMDFRKTMSGEKKLMTISVGPRKEMEELVKLAADGKVRTNIQTMKLDQANEALARVKEGKVFGRIVLVNR